MSAWVTHSYTCAMCESEVEKKGRSFFRCLNRECEHGQNFESELVGIPDWVIDGGKK